MGVLVDYRWSSHLDYAGEPSEWLDLLWLRYWGRGKGRGAPVASAPHDGGRDRTAARGSGRSDLPGW